GIRGGRTHDARRVLRDEHAEKARECLPDRIVGGAIRVRPVGTEAGDRAMHEAWIAPHGYFRAEAEPLGHARPEVLHVHIGRVEELPHHVAVTLAVEVELDALLVAIERLELRAVQPFLEAAEWIAATGSLD